MSMPIAMLKPTATLHVETAFILGSHKLHVLRWSRHPDVTDAHPMLYFVLQTAVYHLRENHTVTLFELRVKSRYMYQLREWPLGLIADNHSGNLCSHWLPLCQYAFISFRRF